MKNSPPRLFVRFFRWYCHPKLRDHIEGDLIEVYNERLRAAGKRKADRKFIVDVFTLFRPGIIKPFQGSTNLTPLGMYKSYFIVATRNMLKQKALNFLNILGLSIGIASGLLIAIHIRGELSYDTSFDNYENIYRVHREGWAASSPPLESEFREFFPNIEAIGRFAPYGTRVVNTDNNNPGEVTGYFADSSVLKIFSLNVTNGDPHPLVAVNTAVITQAMANRYFGKESAIGKILKFDNGAEMPVTAVIEDLPVNSHLKFDFLISMPTFYATGRPDADLARGWMIMYTYFRLKPGDIENVTARMPQFIREYYAGDQDVEQKVESKAWRLMPLKDIHLYSNLEKEMQPNSSIIYVYVFIAIELLILLVASANFMSLFTTQVLKRMKEVGMRKIMGAKPSQIMLQFFTEISLLTLFSAFLAVIFFALGLPFYNDLSGKSLGMREIFELPNLATIGVILATVIVVSGLYPTFFVSGFRPGSFLRENKLPKSMPNLMRSGLVVFQFAVSVSLIAAALIVRQQMNLMKNKDLGFDKDQVINVKLYGDLRQKAFSNGDVFKNEFLTNSDILAVGRVDRIIGERLSVETVIPEGKDKERDHIPDVRVLRADEGYLDAMDIKLVNGRNFSREFNDSASFIINESAAKAFGLTSAVSEILANTSNGKMTGKIVGVVRDYHFATLHAEIEPLVIEFNPRSTDNLVIKIRAGKTRETVDYLRSTVDRLAPHSLFIYQFLDDRLDALYRSEDVMGKIFEFFSGLAIVIACLGLFGLASYTIERRTKEIGIRKVMGASFSGIVALLSSGIFRLIIAGFCIAVPLTWFAMRKWLDSFAYKIEIEWWIFAATGIMVIFIAAIAVGFRTIRAAIANPVDALRNE